MTDTPYASPVAIAEALLSSTRVAVLTGAGMSAESGIPTFRGSRNGLWAEFDPQQLATPAAFRRDPPLVWAWYRWRTALVEQAVPNAGHQAIAQLERLKEGVVVITQNVDDLHERAGSSTVLHLHGSLFEPRCLACARPHPHESAAGPEGAQRQGRTIGPGASTPEAALRVSPPACTHCGGPVRPGVVWFGEGLPAATWNRATRALEDCDALLVVGTSGVVQPAASLPRLVKQRGKPVIEINPDTSEITHGADIHWNTTAAEGLPRIVELLGARHAAGGPT